jgi:ketosteroid isomerase-like protein
VQIPAMTAFERRANGIQEPELVDDLYAINAAKTEFREAFCRGDVSPLLALADPDLVNFSDGQPSEFGQSGLDALKSRLTNLFDRYIAKLTVIVIEIRLQGDVACDYGWHDLTLTPKEGGGPIRRRNRYVDIWRKDKKGKWKLWIYMDNQDVADPLPEQIPAPGAQVHGSF